jgi:hypothetical protein
MADLISTSGARTKVRITFNRRRPPTLDDVSAALGQLMAKSGRFENMDVLLDLGDIYGPDPTPWATTTTWEQAGF